jgi:branched-chain amino acid transport system substrate-binding protein
MVILSNGNIYKFSCQVKEKMRTLTKMKLMYLIIGLVIGILLGMWFGGGDDVSTPTIDRGEIIKIGFIAPLTGDVSNYGASSLGGATIAVEEINAAGGINGKTLELMVEDGVCKPQQATSAATKLIDIDGVQVITGTVCSSETLAIAPIAENNKVVVVSVASSSPDITNSGDYIFRVWPSDAGQGVAMANHIFNTEGLTTVGILHVNSDYNLALAHALTKNFEALGGEVIITEKYEQDAKDFRTQITKVKAENPDAFYIVPYGEGGLLMKQIRELGFEGPIFASETVGTPEVVADAGSAAEGVIYATPKFDDTISKAQDVLGAYKEKYGEEPSFGVVTASAYDALYVIAEALEQGGESADDIRDHLYTINNFPGAAGTLTIDEHGDAIKDFQLMVIQNGEFVNYEE